MGLQIYISLQNGPYKYISLHKMALQICVLLYFYIYFIHIYYPFLSCIRYYTKRKPTKKSTTTPNSIYTTNQVIISSFHTFILHINFDFFSHKKAHHGGIQGEDGVRTPKVFRYVVWVGMEHENRRLSRTSPDK